jgi:hypothetical protein
MIMKKISLLIPILILTSQISWSQIDPVAYWDFDELKVERKIVDMVRGETYVPKEVFAYVKESVSGKQFDLEGKYYKSVKGVNNKAVLLDGYTAFIEIPDPEDIPVVTDEFTAETWVALGAYPKNMCPFVDHQRDVADGYHTGYFFGLDALGRPTMRIATNGKEEALIAADIIPLNTWTHVACTYSEENGMTLYLNGKKIASRLLDGKFTPSINELVGETSMLIGKSRKAHRPYGTIRPEGTERSNTYLDGIIDELKIYDQALTDNDISTAFNANKTDDSPELPERILPSGPQSPGAFRAVNTTLKYYPGWDAPWALADNADVVVQFEDTDCKFVFWHGTSYIPCWVTENNIWFNNGFNEGWNDHGSCEPMSDKKAKYSTVKIIESNDARVVVQWRYALVDVLGNFAFEDPTTGWGDWTNETFTIYPDMTGVRNDVILSNAPNAAHEWQESMIVLGPGQRPEDLLEYGAVTIANLNEEHKTYSWENELPPETSEDFDQGIIQVINTKSEFKPFSVIRPQDFEYMDFYAGEIRRDVSVFPWWNHWPVAPRPTDGRYAMAADRAAHSSLSHWFWGAHKTTDRSISKIMLNGMTNKNAEELVTLTKSWSNPAEIVVEQGASAVYDPAQLAFVITVDDAPKTLNVTIKGTGDSPVYNPAFVVNGWGNRDLKSLKVNGKELKLGKDVKVGYRESMESRDLIVWLKLEADTEQSFSFTN